MKLHSWVIPRSEFWVNSRLTVHWRKWKISLSIPKWTGLPWARACHKKGPWWCHTKHKQCQSGTTILCSCWRYLSFLGSCFRIRFCWPSSWDWECPLRCFLICHAPVGMFWRCKCCSKMGFGSQGSLCFGRLCTNSEIRRAYIISLN